MRRSTFILRAGLAGLAVTSIWMTQAVAAAKPNIIYILVNDMGYREVSALNGVQEPVLTHGI